MKRVFVENSELVDESRGHVQDEVKVTYSPEYQIVEKVDQFLERAEASGSVPD